MIRLVRFLIGLCNHYWQILEQAPVQNEDHQRIGRLFVLRCEKCGNIKKKQIIASI